MTDFRNVRIDLATYQLLKKIGEELANKNGGLYTVPIVIKLLAKDRSEGGKIWWPTLSRHQNRLA